MANQSSNDLYARIGVSPKLGNLEVIQSSFNNKSESILSSIRELKNTIPANNTAVSRRAILRGATYIPAHPQAHSLRTSDADVKYLVIHRPEGKVEKQFLRKVTAEGVINTFVTGRTVGSPKTSHFLISKAGRLFQLAPLDHRCSHIATVKGSPVSNDNSVGVELEGSVGDTFEPEQLQKVALLIALLRDVKDYGFKIVADAEHVIGHSSLNSFRPNSSAEHTDPGDNFPYEGVLAVAQNIAPQSFPDLVLEPPVLQEVIADADSIANKILEASSNLDRALLSVAYADAAATNRAALVLGQTRKDYSTAAVEEAERMVTYLTREWSNIFTGVASSEFVPKVFINYLDVLLNFEE